jgi:hypothetical protein
MAAGGVGNGSLSDEVRALCRRVLGAGAAADGAAEAALAGGETERIALLASAARECRSRVDGARPAAATGGPAESAGVAPATLTEAVAAELAVANASLAERQREALALRELLRLSYEQIGAVMELEPAAVAALLARARLTLRSALRGTELDGGCEQRDRALRILARRQDSEPLGAEDDDWIREHLNGCPACERAHAAMLEASVCYRAWRD